MRRMLWIIAAAALVFPVTLCAQEQQSQSQSQSQSQTQSDSQQTQSSTQAQNQKQNQKSQAQSSQNQPASQSASSATQEDSLAAAARKAREQKKDAGHPTVKVFTNDDLPSGGGISTVGADKGADSAATGAASAAGGNEDAASAGANDEKTWRARFAKLHNKLDQDQAELDLLQRELGVAETQFYGGDPNKAVNDQSSGQPFGAEYNKKISQIDQKKKQIEADKQAISDAEDDLRKSGGDPGWAR
jgi:hypothetical protein